MLLSLAFALLLSHAPQEVAPEPNTVAPAIVQPRRWPGVVPTDLEITRQLNQLVKEQPETLVCLEYTPFGTRMPRNDCKTLRAWYDYELDRDVQYRVAQLAGDNSPVGGMIGPPYELVNMIKARYRLPSVRARAHERARLREAAARSTASPSTPPVSNP